MSDTVEFFGERFNIREKINSRRIGKFAQLAAKGDMPEMQAMAAINDLVDACLRPEDVQRFDAVCDRHDPDFEQLAQFVADVIEVMTQRPTSRPSDSSAGPQTIEPSSTAVSSSPVINRLEGRPDLQLIVVKAQEARAAS